MNPILEMLHSKVIPWTKSNDRCLVVARSVMHQVDLPAGALLERRSLKGKKTPVKNRRHYANQRIFSAECLQSNQQEMLFPKIACVISGTADYLLGDYCLHANEGTFIFIPPGAPHHCKGPFLDKEHLKKGECILLFVHGYSHGVNFWFSRSAGGAHTLNQTDTYLIPNMAVVQMLHLLMDEAVANEDGREAICNSLLFTFYSVIARDVEQGHYMAKVKGEMREIRSLSDEDFASRVREYIMANLYKRLKVEDVARHAYMSASHFSRVLRRTMGKSFVELLTECRLEHAKELLVNSDWTAAYIAGYVGLKSTAYFHEFFQHHEGCTPLEYRRKHQKRG